MINSAHANNFPKNPFDYNLLANGRYSDTETGFHYNGSTYFDPKTGSNIANSPISFAAMPMRYAGNTGLVNSLLATGSSTWPNRPSIGTTTTPTVDWIKVGNTVNKFTRVCVRIGGKTVLGFGTLLIPTSTSRCAGLDPYGRPYPECVGIYSENKNDNLDEYDFPGEGIKPPGNCSDAQYASLRKNKQKNCGLERACKKQSHKNNCKLLSQKIENGKKCINARNKINSVCFKGGDERHIRETLKELVPLEKCISIAVDSKCPGYV